MPLDIMMPFYGDPAHLRLAVASVLAQESTDWRLTVVDDVYPDPEPGRWVSSLADERVSYVRNESNLGVSRNYLKCIDMVEHPYTVIMGCDDVMLPGYVGRILDLITRFPGASMLQTGVQVIDGDGNPHLPMADRVKSWFRPNGNPPRECSGEQLAANLLHANWTYFPSLCWRVDLIRKYGFRADLDVVQDLQMILTILEGGGTLVIDDDINFQYRRHGGSVSAKAAIDGTRFEQERIVFNEARAKTNALGWARAARAASLHATSRLNALIQLPAALAARSPEAARTLLRHGLGRT